MMEDLKLCPRCGATASVSFCSIDVVNGGWSAGCLSCYYFARTIYESEKNLYVIRGAHSKEEAVKRWNERVEHLKEMNKQMGYDFKKER